MKFQHAYSESFRGSDIECKDPSLAQQSFKDEVDINVLLERFRVTGQLPQGVRVPTYGDFTGVSDYRTAMDAVIAAQRSFMEMPANIRAKFGNDPAAFVDFCSQEENLPQLRKWGLAVPEKQELAPEGASASAGEPTPSKA